MNEELLSWMIWFEQRRAAEFNDLKADWAIRLIAPHVDSGRNRDGYRKIVNRINHGQNES